MSNNYEAILFDFDGVLIDSEPVHFQCWREILSPYGFDLDWKTYEDNCVGISDRTMLENFCIAAGPRLHIDQLIAEYPRKKALFRERIAEAEVLHPETLELLRSVRDYKLAVVSSSNRTEVEPTLIRFGIRDYFGALVCGWEAPKLKPAPDPYLKAAELLGVTRALVVEDSAAGEQSGRAAGFDVVRVANSSEVAAQVRAALPVLK
jgi:beta-phosphoglucomutase